MGALSKPYCRASGGFFFGCCPFFSEAVCVVQRSSSCSSLTVLVYTQILKVDKMKEDIRFFFFTSLPSLFPPRYPQVLMMCVYMYMFE